MRHEIGCFCPTAFDGLRDTSFVVGENDTALPPNSVVGCIFTKGDDYNAAAAERSKVMQFIKTASRFDAMRRQMIQLGGLIIVTEGLEALRGETGRLSRSAIGRFYNPRAERRLRSLTRARISL
jgi:hypothetical protein